MGGSATEVTAKTQRILLECASFDPVLIRRAGRALGLTSDSAYRFERGIDAANIENVAKQAVSLLVELTGGVVTHYRDVSTKKAPTKKSFSVNITEISHFIGANITLVQAQSPLGFLRQVERCKAMALAQIIFQRRIIHAFG